MSRTVLHPFRGIAGGLRELALVRQHNQNNSSDGLMISSLVLGRASISLGLSLCLRVFVFSPFEFCCAEYLVPDCLSMSSDLTKATAMSNGQEQNDETHHQRQYRHLHQQQHHCHSDQLHHSE